MKPPRFSYAAPATVREATDLLDSAGGRARVLAGGQSLIPMLRHRLLEPEALIDLRRITGCATSASTTPVGSGWERW